MVATAPRSPWATSSSQRRRRRLFRVQAPASGAAQAGPRNCPAPAASLMRGGTAQSCIWHLSVWLTQSSRAQMTRCLRCSRLSTPTCSAGPAGKTTEPRHGARARDGRQRMPRSRPMKRLSDASSRSAPWQLVDLLDSATAAGSSIRPRGTLWQSYSPASRTGRGALRLSRPQHHHAPGSRRRAAAAAAHCD